MQTDTDVHSLFTNFLADVFSLPTIPDIEIRSVVPTRFDQLDHQLLLSATNSWLSDIRTLEGYLSLAQRPDWLGDQLENAQNELDETGLSNFLREHLTIDYCPETLMTADTNVVYVKLNHGFWEDLYALFVKDHLRSVPRRLEVDISSAGTVESGFLDALVLLLRYFAEFDDNVCSFAGVHLAASMVNGAKSHDTYSKSIAAGPTKIDHIARSSSVGAVGFFEKLFPGYHLLFSDGCFPKLGYETGALREVLQAQANACDQVVLAVPPHLHGIRLTVAGSTPQERIHLSRQTVHESWVASLKVAAHHILQHIASGERVLVVSQFGPFSVLLGLYLAYAIQKLELLDGGLAYFDLGQVPDIADPERSGPWLRNYPDITNDGLFELRR